MQEEIVVLAGTLGAILPILVGMYFKLKNLFTKKAEGVEKKNTTMIENVVKAFNVANGPRDNKQDFMWNMFRTNLNERRNITNDQDEILFITEQLDTMSKIGD